MTVDQVLILNSDRHPSRWREFAERLPPDWTLPRPRRFRADESRPPESWGGGTDEWRRTRTWAVAARSYLDTGSCSVLIVEDSAQIPDGFCEDLFRLLKSTGKGKSVLMICGGRIAGMVVQGDAARRLAENELKLEEFVKNIDCVQSDLLETRMTGKCCCDRAGHCQWHGTVTTQEEWNACRNGTPPAPRGERPCIYLAGETNNSTKGGRVVYDCNLHGKCTLITNADAVPSCPDCKDRLTLDSPDLAERFLDPLIVTDARKVPTKSLRGLLAGGPAFLVCGGPSVKLIDYHRLNERGIFSLGVNNVAGMVPVSAFTCSDPPMKFHWGIFADPRIMKFLPVPKLGAGKQRGQLRTKEEDGTFRWLGRCAKDCPNVWGYERRSWMMPDHTFFTEPHAAWGNQQVGVDRCDQPKTACTMLLGFRLLHYLGARTIFLLGADFRMNPDAGTTNNYAFAQARDEDAINSNNRQFAIAASWLEQLRPTFERFGLNVYNCNPESGLRAFDHVPFEDALRICRGTIPDEPFDLGGWYEKGETKEAEK